MGTYYAQTAAGVCLALCLAACTVGKNAPMIESSRHPILANVSLGFVGQGLVETDREPDLAHTRLALCVREVRFLPASEGGVPVVVEFPDGPVSVSAENYEFGALSVPPGRYGGVTLRLGPRCSSRSLVVENRSGRFEYGGELELTWRTSLVVTQSQSLVWLPARALLSQAAKISDASQVPAVLGGFK